MANENFSGWDLLDETYQLIQVSDLDFNMLYANLPARSFTGHPERPYKGQKCYQYMMGVEEQCPYCPMRQMEGKDTCTTEVDNGEQVFTAKTKLIQWEGKPAFVEYATDVTTIRRAQQIFESQVRMLMASIPDAQGVFHFDLTANSLFSTNGVSTNLDQFENQVPVDQTINLIASFIPDDKMKAEFLAQFSREALIAAYHSGKTELNQKLLSYYADKSIRWTRMTCRLIMNPNNGDLEAILYGMDISREQAYEERIAQAEQENETLLERSKRDLLTGLYTKTAFAELVQDAFDNGSHTAAVIFLDLDHFKDVNDTFGYLRGDQVLRSTARTLQRIFDTESYISRFGGDEFCIYFPGCTPADLTAKLEEAERVLTKTITKEETTITVTASIGASYCDTPVKDFTVLLENADQALYDAKRNGRNQYCIRNLSELSL